ncbi:MAG: RHS repeat protein [Acidobacteria bacterium]|nr:RHS repeat protein [Acidobacteriota bacterium]
MLTKISPSPAIMLVLLFIFLVPSVAAASVKYTYDSAGRLTGVDYGGGVTVAYVYDKSGNLTSQAVSNPVGFSFPFYQADANVFAGFAVSNFSDRGASLSFTAFNPIGQLLPFSKNPFNLTLDSGKQFALLGSEIFGVGASTTQSGWVKLTMDNSDIGSFFLTGSGLQLDGSVAFTQQAKKFYFTRVFEGPSALRGQPATTFLSISNPNDQAVAILLTLFGSAPNQTLGQVSVNIPAKGFLFRSVSQFFGQDLSVSNGLVQAEVTEGSGAVGFELVQLNNQNTVIGLNASFGNSASQLFSAQLGNGQLAPGANIFTDLKLANVSGQPRSVTIHAIAEDGNTLGSPANVNLAVGELLQRDAGELFALGPNMSPPAVSGSIRVEADGSGIIGDIIFGDPSTFNYAAAAPLQTLTFTKAVFSQVANTADIFTGLALYNPGTSQAIVTIEVFSAEGTLTGSASLMVDGGKRLSKVVTELMPSTALQRGGYIVIRSTQPLIAQQLFGDSNLNFLSSVPPTIVF